MTDEDALRAAADSSAAEEFMKRNRQFILRCASKTVHKYITDSDDEWSVAFVSFYEALLSYEPEKGSFAHFAELVIRRRLTDLLRSQARHRVELTVDPFVFDGTVDGESADALLQETVLRLTVKEEDFSLKDEIDAVSRILSAYGFTFYDLTACSPKAEKTRKSCAAVIRFMISSPILLNEMRLRRALPIKIISCHTGVPQKILERHRKYIIAAAEILGGDFPQLADYLRYVWEEARV